MKNDFSCLPPIAIFLCDESGIMARPWADAGVECYCVDISHSIRKERVEGMIHYVWGDCRTWRPPEGRQIIFVSAMSPCTDVTVAGSRDFLAKGGMMLRDALETFEACRLAGAWSGAPYMQENPVGVLSSIPHIGKPNYYFHPWEYTGYFEEDIYTKYTCIWAGNGFVMPEKSIHPNVAQAVDIVKTEFGRFIAKPKMLDDMRMHESFELLQQWYPDDRIHKAPPRGRPRDDPQQNTNGIFASRLQSQL